MRVAFLPGCLLVLAAAGCGSVVLDESTTSGGGSQDSTSGTGGSGAWSSSSDVGGSLLTGTGGTGAGGSGGAPPGCPDGDYFVDVDQDGVLHHYSQGCFGTSVFPAGMLFGGGECSPGIAITACGSSEPPTPQIFVRSELQGVGNGTDVYTTYSDGQGTELSGETVGSMTITVFGDVGGIIEGDYTSETVGMVEGQPTTSLLQGKFRVCREPDQPPCP